MAVSLFTNSKIIRSKGDIEEIQTSRKIEDNRSKSFKAEKIESPHHEEIMDLLERIRISISKGKSQYKDKPSAEYDQDILGEPKKQVKEIIPEEKLLMKQRKHRNKIPNSMPSPSQWEQHLQVHEWMPVGLELAPNHLQLRIQKNLGQINCHHSFRQNYVKAHRFSCISRENDSTQQPRII
ncbi:hypothetical protein HN51_021701 [Arachis hypogaea]